jgi:hypothetical protein
LFGKFSAMGAGRQAGRWWSVDDDDDVVVVVVPGDLTM